MPRTPLAKSEVAATAKAFDLIVFADSERTLSRGCVSELEAKRHTERCCRVWRAPTQRQKTCCWSFVKHEQAQMCGHSSKLESRILNAEGRESVEECSERGFGGAGEDSRTGKESPESVGPWGEQRAQNFLSLPT